jgi:hypothetical protein
MNLGAAAVVLLGEHTSIRWFRSSSATNQAYRKDNPSVALRPKKSWALQRLGPGGGDRATISRRWGRFERNVMISGRKCLECAAIMGDWHFNDMVAAGAYI